MPVPLLPRTAVASLLVLLAAAPIARGDEPAVARPSWWFAAGIGAAEMESNRSAPIESGRTGLAWTLAGGARLRPDWGLGLEVGSNRVESFFNCGFGPCFATRQDLARGKEFDHFLVVTEFRPAATAKPGAESVWQAE